MGAGMNNYGIKDFSFEKKAALMFGAITLSEDDFIRLLAERDAAIADLRYQSACWNCTKNGKDCHANVPMERPNVMCGKFEWRGVRR